MHGVVISLLLSMLLRGIFNVLVKGVLNLLCPLIYVIAPNVEVVESVAEVAVPSVRE